MATNHRCCLRLACLAAAILLLPACKPEIPGGLVTDNRPAGDAGGLVIVTEAVSQDAALPTEQSPTSSVDDVPQQTSVPIVANPGLIPVDVASSGAVPTAAVQPGAQQPAGSQVPDAPVAGGLAFRLSAGVAVPQSLPTGTAMGMSVDYQISGTLQRSSRYVWVVSSEGGGEVEQFIQPQTKGTLQAFFLNLRPEHRPFNCHIEEISPGGRRTRVSNVAVMQTSY